MKKSRENVLHDLTSVAYGFKNKVYLSNRTTNNLSFTQRLKLVSRLDVHNGCVNTICWNDSGQYILSGSDDQHLVIVNPFTGKIEVSLHTAHRANIFSARFLPNSQDKQTVSCSADGLIHFYDFERPELLNGFDCHIGAVYEVLTVPNDSYTFLSCGEDGTVRWFDLRTKTRCIKANCEDDIMINTRQAVMSLAINPMMPFQLAIGCADSTVRVYDRRQLSTGATGSDPSRSGAMLHNFSAPPVKRRNHRITSLAYSHDGEELLVSYSSEHLYLFNFKNNERENQVPLMKSFKDFDEVNGASVDCDASVASESPSCSSSSDAMTSGEYVFRPCVGRQPPVKRLRLRGDWSDTGPNARPEREREPSQDETASSIMQRMSNMLTRLLEGRMRQGSNEAQSSNEAATSHEPEESSEQDEMEGIDGNVLTAESSLSSSGTSSTVFVSCSASDKEASAEDSKEAFEMAECTFTTDQCISEVEECQTFATHPSHDAPDRENAPEIFAEHSEEKIVADEMQFISGNQVVGETVMLEVMPSLSDCCGVVVSGSNDFVKSIECCSKDSSNEVSRAVTPESVTELMDGVSVERGSGIYLSCENVAAEPVNEVLTVMDVSCGQSSDQTTEGSPADFEASDVLLNQQVMGGNLDTFRMSFEGTIDRVESTSAVNREIAIEGSSVISYLSSGIALPSQGCVDGANLDGREDEPKDGASSSLGMFEQQDVSLSGLTNDRGNSSNRPRSSISDLSDDESDSEEPYASPAGRKTWLEQRLDEKNAAASKLQAVFRRHMEAKMKNREAGLSLLKPVMKQCYLGHRNSRTMIKEASFWGHNYVMSGSDCGHIFIWDRQTAKLVMLLEGDRHVVNCLQPHPYHPILASSGIDYDVKIWMPVQEFSNFDYPVAAELMRRNEVMLEETKDTVTVPASFMLRMLLSLNHARRGGRLSGMSRERSSSHNSSASSRDE